MDRLGHREPVPLLVADTADDSEFPVVRDERLDHRRPVDCGKRLGYVLR
ncbi:MAG: hypothetical protein J07HX64_03058 [halophilic archaeon J07HX64]|nr:MAG: hypothetical protein J07HX64_03058 [halophilic archaeon J07HX64]